jgi:endonuclease/exonuclease/phosphatase (EEP) superfamily protein YafD
VSDRIRHVAKWIVILLCGGTSLCAILGFLGVFWWVFDLFSHFRVQYALLLAIGLVGAVALRRWVVVLLTVQILILDVMFLVPAWLPVATPAATAPRLKLLLVNVELENRRHDLVAELIRREDPDVIALVELDDEWARALEPALAPYLAREVELRNDRFGIGLYSKRPFDRASIRRYGPLGRPTAVGTLTLDGRELAVVATHPPPPVTGELSAARDRQLAELADAAPTLSDRVLVLGDLNASPWSAAFREFVGAARLYDSRRGFGLQPTWPSGSVLTGIPIDHVLYSNGLGVVDRRVGPDVGSDHRPVIATIAVLAAR